MLLTRNSIKTYKKLARRSHVAPEYTVKIWKEFVFPIIFYPSNMIQALFFAVRHACSPSIHYHFQWKILVAYINDTYPLY